MWLPPKTNLILNLINRSGDASNKLKIIFALYLALVRPHVESRVIGQSIYETLKNETVYKTINA